MHAKDPNLDSGPRFGPVLPTVCGLLLVRRPPIWAISRMLSLRLRVEYYLPLTYVSR
jgi:hypothetical protein